MSDLEFNKIFAALLVAGLVAMLSGFVAEQLFHHGHEEESAYQIEIADADQAGEQEAKKPQKAAPIVSLLATADPENGEKLSRACAACHTFDKGGAHRIGPNLWNTVGQEVAHADDYAYSAVFEEAEGTWDYERLNQYLWNPRKVMPGTKMTYIGMKNPEDRADLIAWLRTLSDTPEPLPDPEPESESEPAPETENAE